MSFFKDLFKKKDAPGDHKAPPKLDNREKYGMAWLSIVGGQKQKGIELMKELVADGFIEANVALAMFTESKEEKKALVKKAADSGNAEGMWQYCAFLPHAHCPNRKNAQDALWEKYCTDAAEAGSVDAMNELGNIYHRRKHYVESMYWYAMANAYGHSSGIISMQGIAKAWADHGAPYDFVQGSAKFDKARHACAITYLEFYSEKELSVPVDEVIKMVLDGVPIAAYLAADIYESLGNNKMACKIYSVSAQKEDSHGLKCYADMLFTGRGIEKNPTEALYYYGAAAIAGERSAMFIMGEFSKAQSKNTAAYWYGLSHTRGYTPSLTRLISLAK